MTRFWHLLPMTPDVLITGGGPAALALAAAADDLGLQVCILSASNAGHGDATLALFADEAHGLPLRARTERTVVEAGGEVDLRRAYGVLDLGALAAMLPTRVQRISGQARHTDGHTVTLADGTVLRARSIVDATGARPALVQTEPSRPAWQTAYGQFVEGDLGLDGDTALLMDWSPVHDDDGQATFLYALPLGGGRFLVEETVLCARPAVPVESLRRRLEARLLRRGAQVQRVHGEERVAIPMGTGLPLRGQRIAAFGAALGLIHPTSGYSVARSLAHAPRVAAVIADALARGREEPLGDLVLDAVWTREAREARALFLFALEAARRFNRAESERFFAAFFAQPASRWRGFLDGTLDVRELRASMFDLFARGGTRMRLALARGLLGPSSFGVMRGFLGGPA